VADDLREAWRSWGPWEKARFRWKLQARPNQLPPEGDWLTWLLLAGRGFGKTRTGAEEISDYCRRNPNTRIALVGPTNTDVRDTMVEGESGLLSVLPSEVIQSWNRSLASIELDLVNGCHLKGFSAERPGRLRGPQHHRAWADELAQWPDAETWDMLMFGMRLGERPQVIVTTTPRATPLVRSIMGAPNTWTTRGSTYDNLANLAPTLASQILAKYEGTRIGRQELYAEVLDDVEGALWTWPLIDAQRVAEAPDLDRVVVAVDPAGGTSEDNDETGIIVCGKAGEDFYVLADRSCRETPHGWALRVLDAYDEFSADRIVAEKNYGGDMVSSTIRSERPDVPITVVTASRGKRQRAEPISALYEQGHVHHVGILELLEDQLTSWVPDSGRSPDRLDALVWALHDLTENRPRRRARMTHAGPWNRPPTGEVVATASDGFIRPPWTT